jgi:hypothetical protein
MCRSNLLLLLLKQLDLLLDGQLFHCRQAQVRLLSSGIMDQQSQSGPQGPGGRKFHIAHRRSPSEQPHVNVLLMCRSNLLLLLLKQLDLLLDGQLFHCPTASECVPVPAGRTAAAAWSTNERTEPAFAPSQPGGPPRPRPWPVFSFLWLLLFWPCWL